MSQFPGLFHVLARDFKIFNCLTGEHKKVCQQLQGIGMIGLSVM